MPDAVLLTAVRGVAARWQGGGVPSYRVRMVVGDLHPGVDPAAVLPAAADAARELTTVEAAQVDVLRGAPWLTVRFEAPDDLTASGVGRAVVEATDRLVAVEVSRVTRRYGNRWHGLR